MSCLLYGAPPPSDSAPRDHTGAAAVAHEAERPADEHDEPVLEADQVREVNAEPERPRDEAGQSERAELAHRAQPADRRQVALVAVAEPVGRRPPREAVADDPAGEPAPLHPGRREAGEAGAARAPPRA